MSHNYQIPVSADGRVESHAWPGGYPMFYVMGDGEALCPQCVQSNAAQIQSAGEYSDSSWDVVGASINWEDSELTCDHCGLRIESAYAEDRAEVIAGMNRLNKGFMVPELARLSEAEAREYSGDDTAEAGIYARLSAPGYLDCTDWSGPFQTEAEAEADLVGMYDDGGDE